MRIGWDGSVQSSNTPTFDKQGILRNDYSLYRAMVIDVIFSDSPQNISKNSQNPEVLYDVIVLGGADAGQKLSNVRLGSWLGGNNNYSEFTLKKSTKNVSTTKLSDHDGDIVYIQFIQGHDAYPVIIALGKGISNKVAATSSTGPRFIEEYNGMITEVNNQGEYKLRHKGGSASNGSFIPGGSENVTVTISDNKIVMSTIGGPVATIDGNSNNISIKAGSTEILIDGGSGKISLKGDLVDLGSSVSDFVTKFTELATAFNSHIHLVPQAPAGILPSQPPIAPLITSVGSQTVKVQS